MHIYLGIIAAGGAPVRPSKHLNFRSWLSRFQPSLFDGLMVYLFVPLDLSFAYASCLHRLRGVLLILIMEEYAVMSLPLQSDGA